MMTTWAPLPPRTEAILAAIRAELEHRRTELDGDHCLGSVSFVVFLNSRTGRPQKVLFRSESLRDLTAAAVGG